MTFLAPAAGLIAALIAVPLLLSIYFLKLRRRSVRVSTTRFWEQAVSDLQANVPLRWLKPSWLLLLQLLGLACLLIAIARPAVPTDIAARPRTILIIDHSASMSARDIPAESPGLFESRLDAAKREALKLVEQISSASAGERPDVMVIALAAEARIIERFTSDPRSIRDALDRILPTDQPADLEAAARLVQAATVEAGEVARPTRTAAVFFSDGSLEPTDVSLPGSVSIELKSIAPAATDQPALFHDNIGIVALGARRDADNPATARVFARVLNAGPNPVDTVVTCAVDGRQVALLPLKLPPAAQSPQQTAIPGEAGVTLTLDQPAGGLVTLAIARDDLLTADNSVGFLLRPVSKPRVLVVGPNDPSDPILSARGEMGVDRFLLGVLSDLEPLELRVIDRATYESSFVAVAADAGSSTADAPPFDLVVFDRVSPSRAPRIPSIHIGSAPPISGLSLSALPQEQWADAGTRIISWNRNHPVLRYSALDSVLVSPPMRLAIDERAQTAGEVRPTITPIAFGRNGPLIAFVEEPGYRSPHRLVLAFDLARSNWGPQVSFPIFFSTAIDVLTGRGDSAAGTFLTTSEPAAVLPLPTSTQVTITGPETSTIPISPPPTGQPPQPVAIGLLRLTGLYQCQGVEPIDAQLPVNMLSPRESALATSGEVQIGGRPSVIAGSSASSSEKPLREIWKWFVLAAAILLTLEWFMFAFKTRIPYTPRTNLSGPLPTQEP